MNVKFAHVNIVARDWRKLADFYIDVFGCREKPPERDLKGRWLDDAVSLKGAHITGIHLYLPGFSADGPTLEIFRYDDYEKQDVKAANHEGFGHIAFAVDDVDACVRNILDHGGGMAGTMVKTNITGVGSIHFAYARDPEGNIIEIQKWG
ncbi:MAG: VOC family protein [Spirochaetales bacterium]|nr:VOC family protein [Spirochaetales bacterium]